MSSGDSDLELVTRVASNDQAAIEEFVARFWPRLIKFSQKHGVPGSEAEDLAQDAIFAAIKQIQRNQYRGEGQFSSWLFSILNHKIQDYFRGHYRRTSHIADLVMPDALPDRRADQELILVVHDIMELLPPIHRLLLELRYVENRPSKEIKQEINLPVGTIDRKVLEARRMFAELFARRKRDDSATKREGSEDE